MKRTGVVCFAAALLAGACGGSSPETGSEAAADSLAVWEAVDSSAVEAPAKEDSLKADTTTKKNDGDLEGWPEAVEW